MSPLQRREVLIRQIEEIFTECREDVRESIREYEDEVRTALEDLEHDLSASPVSVH